MLTLSVLVMLGATGAAVTVRVNVCGSEFPATLLAIIVKECAPTTVDGAMAIIPVALSILTPVGSPFRENVIGIVPVEVTGKVPPVPYTTLVLSLLVMFGATGAAVTVRVNVCGSEFPATLLAVIVKECTPTAVDGAMVIIPVALSTLTPVGSPFRENVIGIVPVLTTGKFPPVPCTTLVLSPLVIVGATGKGVTVSVKFCCVLPGELLAVIVKLCAPTAVVGAMVINPVALSMVTPVGAPLNAKVIGTAVVTVPVAVT